MTHQRPVGIILIACWYFLSALFTFLGALGVFASSDLLNVVNLASYAIAVGLFLLVIAVAQAGLAWQLLEGVDWARLTILVLQAIGAVLNLLSGIFFFMGVTLFDVSFNSSGLGSISLVFAFINFAIVYYLLQPEVIYFFNKSGRYQPPPPAGFPGGGGIHQVPAQLPTNIGHNQPNIAPNIGPDIAPNQPVVYHSEPKRPSTEGLRSTQAGTQPPTATRFSNSGVNNNPTGSADPTVLATSRPKSKAWLVPLNDSKQHFRLESTTIIGRDKRRAQVVLNDPRSSGEHARIQYQDGQFVLHDLASTNGTYWNKKKINSPMPLIDGDHLRFGRSEFMFKEVRR
ncbi:MAG: FHA domain-containing protein [Ardenticatenaceae bacterium]